MSISKKMENAVKGSSLIRKMFEEGMQLKQEFGADKVYDYSIGSPNVPPPARFSELLVETAQNTCAADHGYMPNAGYTDVRKSVAEALSLEFDVPMTENNIIMTVGASGALNIALKAILDDGDEVITSIPYFVDYSFYVEAHGGELVKVPTRPDFQLDLDGIAKAVTSKTKAVLINSPNNPTGQIYPEADIIKLGQILDEKRKQFGNIIYIIADEPYRKIVFDGHTVPSVFKCYKESIVCSSFSKEASIPGERLGYLAICPYATYKDDLFQAATIAQRIFYVNPPAFMQRVIGALKGECVDCSIYARKKQMLCDGLRAAGYEFAEPKGTFYLFVKSPLEDETQFVDMLKAECILGVAGRGFGYPGYFRLAFCVSDDTIKNSLPGFKKVMESIK